MIIYEEKPYNDFKIEDVVILIPSEGKASDLLLQGKLKWIINALKRRIKPLTK